jgi:UDP-N-acetylglucosamine--N-acetylmuramyl-(pentapeptide) pyrophosphoryl-undecaprenol N-acetylglucosamine transferase
MKVLMAAGGTGGHIFPAISVAEELCRRRDDVEVIFVGSERRLEGRLVPDAGFRFIPVAAAGFPRRVTLRWFPALGALARGMVQVTGVLRRERPRVVFGTGGYVSGPVLAIAAASRIPTIVHESNVVAGLTNRWLGPLVREVHVGFEQAVGAFPAYKVRVSGIPVRRAILDAARERAAAPGSPRTLLVVGGSQGARRINSAVIEALGVLADMPLRIVHQTGELDLDRVRQAYADAAPQPRVPSGPGSNAAVLRETGRYLAEPFFKDMGVLYSQADVIVCRAGAITIAEIAACRLPAVLVPLPHREQQANARMAADVGAALVVDDAALDGRRLVETLRPLLDDPSRLRAMSLAWERVAQSNAAETLADAIEQYLG